VKALAEQIARTGRSGDLRPGCRVRGLLVEAAGPVHAMPVGARVIDRDRARIVLCPAKWSALPRTMRC
jgi:hypothetical protein